MRILGAEDKQKSAREEKRGGNQRKTEGRDGADNGGVLPAKPFRILTACESRAKNVSKQIREDGKHHPKPAQCSDFGDGVNIAAEKTEEKNRDLSLKAKKDGVGCEVTNEALHGAPVFLVFGRVEIDHASHVTAQHPVLKEQRRGTDRDGDGRVQKKIHQRDQDDEPGCGAGEIDGLNPSDV